MWCCAFLVFQAKSFPSDFWRFNDGVWRCVWISYVYIWFIYCYDIPLICALLHNIMLWVLRELAGVEVLCGRLAAFVLVKKGCPPLRYEKG